MTVLDLAVGEQNLPSQNVSLWHCWIWIIWIMYYYLDDFRLIVYNKQMAQEETLTFPLTALKYLVGGPSVLREQSP